VVAAPEKAYVLGGLRIGLRFDGIDPEPYRSFFDELSPFEGAAGDAGLLFRVRPAKKKPGPGIDEPLARALWAPNFRFPFEERPTDRLRVQLKQVSGFLGDPEVARVFEKGSRAGWDRVFVAPSIHGPTVFFSEEGRVEVFRHGAGNRLAGPSLMSVFFQVLSAALCSCDGLLVHGTGIAKAENGYAFLGLSGAGKTTVGRLSPGALFADDGLILRRVNGEHRVYTTPFCQQKTESKWEDGLALGSAPLRNLLFLEQSEEHRLEEMSGPEAALMLLQHYIHYFRLFPDTLARAAFRTVTDLVRAVPPKRLHFRRDEGFWKLLE
jgi:hypothetical protein